MAAAVEAHWPQPLEGLVITRYGHTVPTRRIEVLEAGHPVPDVAGLAGASRIASMTAALAPEDLVLCLLSGGGSALMTAPHTDISLADVQALTSALLACGQRLVGRSLKYHRPRGIVTAGPEEPCALVDVVGAAGREPNRLATTLALQDDMEVESQNRWPSLRTDVGVVDNVFSRLLPAGFYYKTFMWPASFWEKVSRRISMPRSAICRATPVRLHWIPFRRRMRGRRIR